MNTRTLARIFTVTVFGALVPAFAPPAAVASDDVGRRYALIVGVSNSLNQGVPRLNFVDHDIEKLGDLLKREGYDVTTVPNEYANRERILRELYKHAVNLDEKDTFVLYYAGHGVRNVEVNRKTYWLTYDADLKMLDLQGIRLEHLLSYVDDIRAGRKLILLDHCFSGDVEGLRLVAGPRTPVTIAAPPATAGAAPAATPAGPRLRRSATVVEDIKNELIVPGSEGTAVIAAARDEAYELRTLRHGVFTQALLDACSMSTGAAPDYRRSVLELVGFVKARVPQLLKEARAPSQTVVDRVAGSAIGLDWTFCTVSAPKAEVAARAADYAATIQGWETKGLLSAQRRVTCAAVLDKWKAAEGNQAALSLPDNRILSALRLFTDSNDMTPEQARAAALNAALEGEGY